MSENRQLLYWLASIFTGAFLLVTFVVAHDRQIDKCIVDHLFHFHIDDHAVREELDRMTQEKRDRESRTKEWVNDIRCWKDRDSDDYGSDIGTVGPPDRDQ